MTIYAESSAVLAWMFGQPRGSAVHGALAAADLVVASALTLVECDRAFRRQAVRVTPPNIAVEEWHARLETSASGWSVQAITPDVIDRARRSFPDDSIRALDAIHLASALLARSTIGDLDLLSLDDRVRTIGARLGFRVLPE